MNLADNRKGIPLEVGFSAHLQSLARTFSQVEMTHFKKKAPSVVLKIKINLWRFKYGQKLSIGYNIMMNKKLDL